MNFKNFVSFFFYIYMCGFLIISGCSSDKTSSPANKSGFLDQNFLLAGTPVIKIISVGPQSLLALTERHISHVENNRVYYAHDHERQLFLLKPNKEPNFITIDIPKNEEYTLLTDIAPGPREETAWISYTHYNKETDILSHTLMIVSDLEMVPKIEWSVTDNAQFENLDSYMGYGQGTTYHPLVNTLEVSQIAFHNNNLGLVARNRQGTLYAERYIFSDSTFQIQIILSRHIFE